MDLRLREVTWLRLLTLLAWTLLVMLKRGISQLIELIEVRVFERSEQAPVVEVSKKVVREATLLPPLSDELVLERIWPLLHKRVNISLLWRLRRVSRAWKEGVGTTLEWAALEFVRIDSPGFTRYIDSRGERRPSLRERVEDELASFSQLLSEQLADYVTQSDEFRDETCDFEEGRDSSGSSGEIGYACVRSEFPCRKDLRSRDVSEYREWSEKYDSSSEESMRVYYPRHRMRD